MPIIRKSLLLTLYGAVVFTATLYYIAEFPMPDFWLKAETVVLAGVFLLSALAAGRWLGGKTPAAAISVEGPVWSAAAGLVALSLVFFLLGIVGFYRPLALASAVFIFFLTGLKYLTRNAKHLWDRRDYVTLGLWPTPLVLLTLVAGAVGGVAVLCALAPPTYYDSLVYHLALPAQYLQSGRMGFIPYNHYSHFPQYAELVFGWFLAMGRDTSAQLFCLGLAGLTFFFLHQLGRPFFETSRFRWDLAFFCTAPCVWLLSTETYVESFMALFTTLAVVACQRGVANGGRKEFVWAGAMAGYAAGVKYTGAITGILLTLAALFWPRPRSFKDRCGDAALLAGVAFSVFAPWLVKNYFYTGGNPVFPFLPGLFPANNVYMFKEASDAYFQVLSEYKGASFIAVEWLNIPLRLVSHSMSFGGGFDVTGDFGWVLPFLLLPACWGLVRSDPAVRFWTVYLLVHVLLWASMRPVLRFLYPVFPMLCLLSGMGFSRILGVLPIWARAAALGCVATFLVSNGFLFSYVQSIREPFAVALGIETREAYLQKKISAYPAWHFVSQELPPESRLLIIGDQRGYYIGRPYVAPMALLPNPLRVWADESADGEALRKKLLELGFTHLLFNREEAKRLESYRVLDLTDKGRAAWENMLGRLPRLYDAPAVTVFSLS